MKNAKNQIAIETVESVNKSSNFEFTEAEIIQGIAIQTRIKGSRKNYIDRFGNAVSEFEKTIRNNKTEADSRNAKNLSLAEQIAEMDSNSDKLFMAKINKPVATETVRYSGWNGDTTVFNKSENKHWIESQNK